MRAHRLHLLLFAASVAIAAPQARATRKGIDAKSFHSVPVTEAMIREMPRQTLLNTYGEAGKKIRIRELKFSPSGNLIAFTLDNITSGDPEQLWVWDIRTSNLRRMTEVVKDGEIGMKVQSFDWQPDDTLKAEVFRIDWKDQANNRQLLLTLSDDGLASTPSEWRREGSRVFPSPGGRYEIRETGPPSFLTTLFDLKKNRTLYQKKWPFEKVAWLSDNRFAFVEGQGHGLKTLGAATIDSSSGKVSTRTIREGSWELLDFVVDPGKDLLFFPFLEYKAPFSIVGFDVKKGAVTEAWQVGRYPGALAISGAGTIAYTADGCFPAMQGESALGDGQRSKEPHSLCLLQR